MLNINVVHPMNTVIIRNLGIFAINFNIPKEGASNMWHFWQFLTIFGQKWSSSDQLDIFSLFSFL